MHFSCPINIYRASKYSRSWMAGRTIRSHSSHWWCRKHLLSCPWLLSPSGIHPQHSLLLQRSLITCPVVSCLLSDYLLAYLFIYSFFFFFAMSNINGLRIKAWNQKTIYSMVATNNDVLPSLGPVERALLSTGFLLAPSSRLALPGSSSKGSLGVFPSS